MKSSKFSATTINVGNLSMGGTGKSPHIEYLIRLLKDDYSVATLSRGFGRSERGFILADKNSTAKDIGDEPLQFYKKYGNDIKVAVEADRVLGAMDLFRLHPEINVLLLDDAYQHRAIHADLNILLTDYNAPFYNDFILPVGNLREARKGKKRADIIVVTKCPDLSSVEKNSIKAKVKMLAHQQIYFSSIKYGELTSLYGNEETSVAGKQLILVTGIANSTPLVEYLSGQATILHHFKYADHHKFRTSEVQDVYKIFDKFASENPLIITTEKDAMRLIGDEFKEEIESKPWFYQSIEVVIDREEDFNKEVRNYVEENN